MRVYLHETTRGHSRNQNKETKREQRNKHQLKLTRNLPDAYVATADGVQETELNAQTNHCSAKCENEVIDNNSLQHGAGCIMVDECVKFH